MAGKSGGKAGNLKVPQANKVANNSMYPGGTPPMGAPSIQKVMGHKK